MRFVSIVVVMTALALGACTTEGDDRLVEYSVEDGVGEFGSGTQHDIYANFAEALGTSDRVLFAFDSAVLDDDAQAIVAKWAVFLLEYPSVTVVVEGHCDERGSREYNLALGERRAVAVANLLVAEGVDPGRIATVSFGKERPAVLGHDSEAWAANRRAVLTPG